MIRRLFAIAVIAGLTAACASSPQPARVAADPREKDPTFRYGPNPGQSPVGVIPDVPMNDGQRNRDFKITIEYPTRQGPHPVIVFSHATGGSNRSYPGLSSHWTGYGYVVIRVSHADNDTNIEAMTPALWRDRARDITFVLDSLTALAQRFPELEGKIDANRIGVAGHARGGMTALMLGGMRLGTTSFADPRVKAVLAMSPAGPQEAWGWPNASFASVTVPALYMTGTRDSGATETETPEWRQQAFELAPAGDKWLVILEDASSGTFTGLAGAVARDVQANPPPMDARRIPGSSQAESERQRMTRARQTGLGQRAIFSQARALALAFFDTYLKDNTAGRDYLREADTRANVDVKSK